MGGSSRRLGHHSCNRFTVISGLAHSQYGAILKLRPEPRDGVRELIRSDHIDNPGCLDGLGLIDGVNAGPGHVQCHELDVEDILQTNIGYVLLTAVHPADTSNPAR
jgi:hypothetical protein